MRRGLIICAIAGSTLVTATNAEAGIGKLLRKGLSFLGRQATDVAEEGVEAGAKKGAAESTEALSKSAGKIVISSGTEQVSREMATQAMKTTARLGSTASETVLARLGQTGLRSMDNLSSTGATRLADVSEELARSPYREEWLTVIGRYGDAAAEFLWARKGSIAVATVATAAVLAPADFLQAGEQLVESTVSAAGTHVIEPLISQTAQHVAAPIATEVAKQAAANFPWTQAWCSLFVISAVGIGYRQLKRK